MDHKLDSQAPSAPASFLNGQRAQKEGRWAEAEAAYRETLASHPNALPALQNLAAVLLALGKWDQAEPVMRAALSLGATDPILRKQLAFSRLAAGDYEEGLPLYESRRDAAEMRGAVPRFSFPEWEGEPVGSLLLMPEQGLGDQIQFARYVPLLVARGVRVTLACPPVLRRLFEPLGVALVEATGTISFSPHDAWAMLGSLPLRFDTRLETIPSPTPIEAKARTSGGVGVATRGNPEHPNDQNRSLPDSAAAALLAIPGAISLLPEHTGAQDMQETADLIAGLDLVISVDTSIAHLAASMGKPTRILLPNERCDWRWMREGERSPWYPSARLVRQAREQDWASVVEVIRAELC